MPQPSVLVNEFLLRIPLLRLPDPVAALFILRCLLFVGDHRLPPLCSPALKAFLQPVTRVVVCCLWVLHIFHYISRVEKLVNTNLPNQLSDLGEQSQLSLHLIASCAMRY